MDSSDAAPTSAPDQVPTPVSDTTTQQQPTIPISSADQPQQATTPQLQVQTPTPPASEQQQQPQQSEQQPQQEQQSQQQQPQLELPQQEEEMEIVEQQPEQQQQPEGQQQQLQTQPEPHLPEKEQGQQDQQQQQQQQQPISSVGSQSTVPLSPQSHRLVPVVVEEQASESESHEYVVEDIVDKKVEPNGDVKFLVKWENYPSSYNSWEPLDNLRSCEGIMKSYEIRRAQALAKIHGNNNPYGEGPSRIRGPASARKDKRHQEYKVRDIVGLTELKDERYFLVSLQNGAGSAFIRSSLANKLFPGKVIDFYTKHIKWRKSLQT